MTFKLIREADTIVRLGDKADLAKKIQQAMGVDSITVVAEAVAQGGTGITPAHYTEWLHIMLDIADADNLDLNRKADFEDVAMSILDNDSFVDGIGGNKEKVKGSIVKALWSAYQASKSHNAVQRHVGSAVRQAHEDEEEVDNLVGCEDEQTSELEAAFDAANGIEDEESMRTNNPCWDGYEPVGTKMKNGREVPNCVPAENEESIKKTAFYQQATRPAATNPYPPNTLRAALWDEKHKRSAEDEERFYDDAIDGAPTVDAVGDDMDCGPDEGEPTNASPDEIAQRIMQDVEQLEDRVDSLEQQVKGGDADSAASVVPKSFDDEEQVKNLFRQAITAPKEHLSAALKDIEGEGAKAFQSLSMPQNPHPKKSPAYNAWAKGFKSSAKLALGVGDKPREVPSKHRSKRK